MVWNSMQNHAICIWSWKILNKITLHSVAPYKFFHRSKFRQRNILKFLKNLQFFFFLNIEFSLNLWIGCRKKFRISSNDQGNQVLLGNIFNCLLNKIIYFVDFKKKILISSKNYEKKEKNLNFNKLPKEKYCQFYQKVVETSRLVKKTYRKFCQSIVWNYFKFCQLITKNCCEISPTSYNKLLPILANERIKIIKFVNW